MLERWVSPLTPAYRWRDNQHKHFGCTP
eukprot:COSAG01_NODE_69691_length_260_cov_1.590062_2_plen_27_part_01